MRSVLPIFLLSVCALSASHVNRVEHRDSFEEIFQNIATDHDYALEKIRHTLNHTKDKSTKVALLQERAFLYAALQSPKEALEDLDTIISMLSDPSKDQRFALVKALWMHLALCARMQDAHHVKKDLEQIKKWDKSFPKVDIHDERVHVAAHNNTYTNFYAFNEMLENFGLRAVADPKLITINAGYFESQINEKADYHLVNLAAACAFTDSPWGIAAWEYVGKTLAPEKEWSTHYTRKVAECYVQVLKDLVPPAN